MTAWEVILYDTSCVYSGTLCYIMRMVLWYVYMCVILRVYTYNNTVLISTTVFLCDWHLQVIEAVASVVSCLQGDSQAAATRGLLEPIMTTLQARLQQPHPNGAGPAQQPSEDVEHIGAFVDRLGTVFK